MKVLYLRRAFAAAALTAALSTGACSTLPGNEVTFRAAPYAALETIDPIWTTSYITRSYGYLVYDTLFAMDQNFQPQPQMVDTWKVSPDQLTWTFHLRDGLKWDNGTPVTAADCVASLERWGKRDGVGQALFSQVSGIEAADARTIVIHLKAPYANMLAALAKISSNVPFMMPARVASTDPNTPITDPTGSGPFMFDKKDWNPGKLAVFLRNPYYVPRQEPTSLAAGGKVAKVDRIEWISYPTQEDAVQALVKGDVDYLESPSTSKIQELKANPDVTVAFTDPLGNIGMAVFNQKIPPFDLAPVRRAVLMAMDQKAYMTAALQDPLLWHTCYSIYPCGTAYATDAGSKIMQTASIEAARKALKTSGYEGTTVVILNPTDNAVLSAFTKVTVDLLHEIGMKVEVRDMKWADLVKARTHMFPDAKGQRWNMFHTWWVAADLLDPTRIAFSGDPKTGWIGWPLDSKLEKLRADFVVAKTEAERKDLAAKVQERIYDDGMFGILGQFYEPIAYRNNVVGIQSPIQMYYNLGFAKKPEPPTNQ